MLSTPWPEQLEYVLSSDHTLVGSKISTVEAAVLAVTACVILAGHQERRPRRVYVWPYSKVREKYRASDLLYQMIKPKMTVSRVYTGASDILPNTKMLLQLVARFYENFCYHFSVSKHVADKDYGEGGGGGGGLLVACC